MWIYATLTLFGTLAVVFAILCVIGVIATALGPQWGTAFLILVAIGIVPAMMFWAYGRD